MNKKLGDTAYLPDIKRLDYENKLKRNLYRPAFKDTVQVPSGKI